MPGRVGKHHLNKKSDSTIQSRIVPNPALPCSRECGRKANALRKDGLCDNCGTIQDTHGGKK